MFFKDTWTLMIKDSEPVSNMLHMSLESLKFINDLVRFDYKKRPNILEVLEHEYFKVDLSKARKLSDVIENEMIFDD